MSVEAKRQELQAIRDQISQIDPSSSAYATLKAQEAALEAEISELKTAAQQTAIEEKVQGEEVHIAIEGVEFEKLPTSLVTVIDKVVKADRRVHFAQHAIEIEQIENAAEERELQLRRQNEELQKLAEEQKETVLIVRAQNGRLEVELLDCRTRIGELELENEDLQSRLSNASAQLEEKNAEIERLQSEIADYQKAKVFGEREAQNIIDVTPSDAEEINNAIKQFLSAEDWGSIIKAYTPEGGFALVKREEFEAEWQPITPPALPDGGSDTQESFRYEDPTSNDTDREGTAALPAMEVSQFPEEGDIPGTDSESVRGEVADAAVTLEERVMMLEQSNLEMQTWIDSIEKRVGKIDGQEQRYSGDEDEAA